MKQSKPQSALARNWALQESSSGVCPEDELCYSILYLHQTSLGLAPFICTVEIGGIQYIGAAARTKKEAEIKAARTALLYQAVDVEKDETILAGDAHDPDVLMQPTVIAQEPSRDALFDAATAAQGPYGVRVTNYGLSTFLHDGDDCDGDGRLDARAENDVCMFGAVLLQLLTGRQWDLVLAMFVS